MEEENGLMSGCNGARVTTSTVETIYSIRSIDLFDRSLRKILLLFGSLETYDIKEILVRARTKASNLKETYIYIYLKIYLFDPLGSLQ